MRTGVFARDLQWRALRIEDADHANELVELVIAVTYRVAHSEDPGQLAADIDALAEATSRMRSPRWPQLPQLSGWCEGAPAALVRALTSRGDSRAAAETALVALLPSAPSPPGEDYPHGQLAAIAGLTALASRAGLTPRTVEGIVTSFEKSGQPLGLNTPLNRLLFQTAAYQSLPQPFRERVFELVQRKSGAADFETVERFRLLSRNAIYLTQSEQNTLRKWLDREGNDNRTLSRLHEAIGYLARAMPISPREIEWLVARLSPYSWLSPQSFGYRGEWVISASDGEAAIALSRVNQSQPLEPAVINRLLTIAAHRSDLPNRSSMLRGLGFATESLDQAIVEALSRNTTSAITRRLYVDIAVAQLRAMPSAEVRRTRDALLQRWQKSRAPELRVAVGDIIGRTMEPGWQN